MRALTRRSNRRSQVTVVGLLTLMLVINGPMATGLSMTDTPEPEPAVTQPVEPTPEAAAAEVDVPDVPEAPADPAAGSIEPDPTGSTADDGQAPMVDPVEDVDESTAPQDQAPMVDPVEDEVATDATDEPSAGAEIDDLSVPAVEADSAAVTAPIGIMPLAVPPATGNDAVITVKVGGDRVGQTAVDGLGGVRLQLYDGADGGPTTPVGDAWATCTSDSDGDCSFVVPETQQRGANRDRRFWVVRTGTPSGWFSLNPDTLKTGPSFQNTPYRFRTDDELRRGETYSSTSDFMVGTGDSNRAASGGIWQVSRNNPVFPAKCGLNVALVLDLSGSVGSALPDLQAAARTFTNSLVGTPSQVALFTFASSAPANTTNNQNRPLTSVSLQSGADTVNGWINGTTSGGGTNWDRAFSQVAASTSAFDIAVVITDGNPTFYQNAQGPGDFTRFREMENGIFSANAVKAGGTRMIAFGVGAGVSGNPANLQAISGTTAGSDYYQTTDYAQAGQALRELALGNCKGTITVVKQVLPPGLADLSGGTPAGGWTFTTQGSTSVTVAPQSGTTADDTGAVSFDLTFGQGTSSGPITVTETIQSGYTLVPQAGLNATCRRLDTSAPVTVTNSGGSGFLVQGQRDFPISCLVYNRAPSPTASVVVNKSWVVNGVTYPEGQQPEGLEATLLVDGTQLGWGVRRGGYERGDQVTIDESVRIERGQCLLTSSRVTAANGATVDLGLPYTATLAAGDNTYGITNTVDCPTRLTLAKTVVGGNADPASWNLSATSSPATGDPTGPVLPGPSGTTGVSAPVTPDARYALSESGGDPLYVQRVGLGYDPANQVPGSTVSWTCQEVDGNGVVIPGFADGLNGGVRVPLGFSVRCTALNETASLTLVKEVVGGGAQPSDWRLTATPTGTPPQGVNPVSVTGASQADAVAFNVRPGQEYRLTEVGKDGFTLTGIRCVEAGLPRPSVGDSIILAAGAEMTCTFTNTRDTASVEVTKVFAKPADLTLSSGFKFVIPVDCTVDMFDQVVEFTAADITANPQALTRTINDVPTGTVCTVTETAPVVQPGWTWGAPSFDPENATQDAAVVTVTKGQTVAATVTNTISRNQHQVTLQKAWVNARGGDTAALTIAGGLRDSGQPTATSTATGATGTVLDSTNVATATVRVGDTVTVTEVLGAGNASKYGSTLACTSGNVTVTVDDRGSFQMPDAPVSCTFTNDRSVAVPTQPTVTAEICDPSVPGAQLPGSITIPANPDYAYFIDGAATAAGTYPKPAGSYKVVAQLIVTAPAAAAGFGGVQQLAAQDLYTWTVLVPGSPVCPVLVKESSPATGQPVVTGQTVGYSITVRNGGDTAVVGETLVDTLPTGVELISGSINPSNGVYNAAARTITWKLDLAAASGTTPATATFTYQVTVTRTSGSIVNSVSWVERSLTASTTHPVTQGTVGGIEETPDEPDNAVGGSEDLPTTGADDAVSVAGIGLLAMVLGGLMVGLGRRRRGQG